MFLQTCGKLPEALIEHCRIVPESRVSHFGHYLNLSMGQTSLVLLDSSWFDNRIIRPLRDQHRLTDSGQEIIIVEGAREHRLADIRGNGQAIPQHQVQVFGCEFSREAQAQ